MSTPDGAEIQFIEIAACDTRPWEACLTALGFDPGSRIWGVPGQNWGRGNHRGRIFTCGGVRVLVTQAVGTSEVPRNLAAEYHSGHGDGAARVSLRVLDVPLAQRRAIAAGASAVTGQMRHAAPDGNAMVESAHVDVAGVTWQLFAAPGRPALGRTPAEAGQMSVDHLVLAVDRADLDSTARLYSQALAMQPLYAEHLRAGDEQMRLVALDGHGWALIIAAQEPAAAPGVISAFLRAHGGSGIMHVAFRVPDIVTAVSQATARGAKFVPVPAAHYDSASDDLGYTPPNLDKLRRYRIAVGRDTDGAVTCQAAIGPVSAGSEFTFGLIQRPAGSLAASTHTAAALVQARAAAAMSNSAGEGS